MRTNVPIAVRTLRRRHRLRQDDLGRQAGVSRDVVSRAELGELDGMTIGSLARLANALDGSLVVEVRWQGASPRTLASDSVSVTCRALQAFTAIAFALSLAAIGVPAPAPAAAFTVNPPTVFINEIHYDNAGTDAGEFVEIAGPAGTDLTGWSMVLYNGNGGVTYDTDALVGVIPDQQNGYGTVSISYPSNGIQNGGTAAVPDEDGIALVNGTTVVQFLSYEGSFTATNGPAATLTSTDIGVSETGTASEPAGLSLQLQGIGTTYQSFTWAGYQSFTWAGPIPTTQNAVNTGQTFVAPPPPNQPVVANCPATSTPQGTATFATVTASIPDGTVGSITIDSGAPTGVTVGPTTPESEVPPSQASATVTVSETTAPGTYDVVMRVTNGDATPQSTTCTLTITVVAANARVSATCGSAIVLFQGDSTTATITASDPDGTVTSIVIELPAPPPSGISVGPTTSETDTTAASATVTISGATAPGSYTLTLRATNSDAAPQSQTCTLSVTINAEGPAIWEIQGSQHISPFNGAAPVSGVDGIVTARSTNGFWMTDPEPDADDSTSNGIFVFRGAAGTKPEVGNHVIVNGSITEFRAGGATGPNLTLTQFALGNTFVVRNTGNALPIQVIGAGGRIPPTSVIHPGSTSGTVEDPAAGFDPTTRGIDFHESLEGMLVRLIDPLSVGPRNRFGEIAVVVNDDSGATSLTVRNGIYVTATDFNPERFIIDDVIAATPAGVNTGDEFTTNLDAVADYGFGNYKYLVTSSPTRIDNGLEREVTDAPTATQLSVATYNVENLAGTDPQSKYDALAAQIINNLLSPDLIGIEEVQDNDGTTNVGITDASLVWSRLKLAIVTAGGPLYDHRQIDPVNNADGGQPGGNIRVGFLFRTDRGLAFVDRPGGTSTNETAVTGDAGSPRLTFSPGRIGSDDAAFTSTRKSLVGEFTYGGRTFFAIVNHLSSKGGDHPLFGRYQPPVRSSEFNDGDGGWRWGQAQILNDFVDTILASDANASVVLLGDINDFQFSDTVRILTGEAIDTGAATVTATGAPKILTTLFDLLPGNQQYSYVFDGNSQVLDQILVSGAMLGLVPIFDVVHVNSEFADQISDHDPSVMRIQLGIQPTPTLAPSPSPTLAPSPTATATATRSPSPTPRSGTLGGTGGPSPTAAPLPDTAASVVDGQTSLSGVFAALGFLSLAASMALGRRRPEGDSRGR